MIYEPKTEMHYSIWVDGFLPSKNTLVEILSDRGKSIYEKNPNDTTLMEEFEHQMAAKYSQLLNDQSTHTDTFAHLLQPCYSHSLPGAANPIKDEWFGLNNNQNYRLFVMLKKIDNESIHEHKFMKKAFLDTINAFHFNIKPEESYRNLENFKNYLGYFSDFFLHRYFFPFESIRDEVKNLGFNSEDALV